MEPLISIRGVNHFFGTGPLRKQILFDVSADILPGEIVINTGPSGSGKTTLLTLAGALRSVQEGSLRVLNQELYQAEAPVLVGDTEEMLSARILEAEHKLYPLALKKVLG